MLEQLTADLVGEGEWCRNVRETVRQLAARNTPVLLLGEPGTGKELIARSIHFASRRRTHPFVSIDAALYYERELERELFGVRDAGNEGPARKGLLEFASRGTCYVSSSEELSAAIQQRLLELIVTGRFRRIGSERTVSSRVRIVLSSTKNLRGFSDGGLFSSPLFEQFKGQIVESVPLRARPEDVVPFVVQVAQHIRMERAPEGQTTAFSQETLEALRIYPWPGNYDELKSEILRVLRASPENVGRDSLSPEIVQHWLGRQAMPQVRRVIEELESYIQEFRILVRLDAEYGDVLMDTEKWDVGLKCYDRF